MHRAIVICLVLAALSVCAACNSAPVTPVATAPAPQPTPAATPTEVEWRAAVLGAFDSAQPRASRQRSETVLADGTRHQTVVEFAPPASYHIVADGATELIVIGERVYLKDSGAWTEANIPAGSLIDRDFAKRLERTLSDLTWLGSETLNGAALHVYQFKSAIKVGEDERIGQFKVWINPADQLPYQLVINGETAALDNRTGQITGVPTTTTIKYEYDPTIAISAPK